MGVVDLPNMERVKGLFFHDVKDGVQKIITYLEDTTEKNQVFYFDGWSGLGASAVLRSVAEDPPPSLRSKFHHNIIHIDCSRWKNRRQVQRTIAQNLGSRLPQHVMALFDRMDEDDDYRGMEEASRMEITDVGKEIYQVLEGQSNLVVFHNGSHTWVELNDFGIPRPSEDRWSNILSKVLWTFRGRLRAIPGMAAALQLRHERSKLPATATATATGTGRQRVDKSHVYLHSYVYHSKIWITMLYEEAAEIAQYMNKPAGVVSVVQDEIASCLMYLLSLNADALGCDHVLDFNWATHASNYWVCDGLIQNGQQDQAWGVAAALHEDLRLRLEDKSPYGLPKFDDTKRWIVTTSSDREALAPATTSFFFAGSDRRGHDHPPASLPDEIMFQRSEQLQVLKLCHCTFNFSSPPFLHCRRLRFLGLDRCNNQPQKLEEINEQVPDDDRPTLGFFQSLWVLDICHTDWELTLSSNILEEMAINIREIYIKRGRIWHNKLKWRRLQNIHKLRVIEPTRPWQTGSTDEFIDMLKLELLDLSGNITIQVLPSLSGATALTTLVLDGCTGLDHIGPEGLPPLLETFSLHMHAGSDKDGNYKEAKIYQICMVSCARLVSFRLGGSLPNLVELDLSNTLVKTLDLKDEVVQVPRVQRIFLLGCERLRAILWPKNGMPKLQVLCIDSRRGTEAAVSEMLYNSMVKKQEEDYCREDYCRVHIGVTDMRFLQSLVLQSGEGFSWKSARYSLSLCLSSTSKDGQSYNKEMVPFTTQDLLVGIIGSHMHNSPIYDDVNFEEATMYLDDKKVWHFELSDFHVEIDEGISSDYVVVTEQRIRAVSFVIQKVKSLLVHDNLSITNIIPKSMVTRNSWSCLKWCYIKRCSKLNTVFITTDYEDLCFYELQMFWAADLLMARCIWSEGSPREYPRGYSNWYIGKSFTKLQAIHLHLCPRLRFVLPLSWNYTLSRLETLHIVHCGDLTQVFPVEAVFLNKISTDYRGVLVFPELKHIHLHELPKLHQICGAKIFAPKLQNIWVRGCWSLKRLPATSDRLDYWRPVVDCEKDWWDNLEWDGVEADHHPFLFKPRHSRYYKKNLLRGRVLR